MCSTTVILTVSTGDAVSIYAVCDARLKVRFRVGYVGVGCQSFSLRWMMSWGVARKERIKITVGDFLYGLPCSSSIL